MIADAVNFTVTKIHFGKIVITLAILVAVITLYMVLSKDRD